MLSGWLNLNLQSAHNILVAVTFLILFWSLCKRNYCSALYTVYYKQSINEGLHVYVKIIFYLLTVSTFRFSKCYWCLQPLKYISPLTEEQGSFRWPNGFPQWLKQHCWDSCGDLQKQRLASKMSGIPSPGSEFIYTVWSLHVCWQYIIAIEQHASQCEHMVKPENYCKTTKYNTSVRCL